MKALVIGGTGPTGPYLVSGLQERGYDVTILHRGTHEVPLPGDVEHIHADPHFLATVQAGVGHLRFDLVIATYGRLRLFIDALDGVTDRLITIGAPTYVTKYSMPAKEDDERQMSNKLLQRIVETEQALQQAHDANRYNITHFRYPNLYGPRQLAAREWSIIRRILDGRRVIPVIDGGLTLESRAYVENAAYAVLLGVDKPVELGRQMYNVNDDYTPSDADRIDIISEHMGVDVELLNLPRDVGKPAYFVGIGRDLDFSRERRAPYTHHRLLDNTKMQVELGYRDPVDFVTGLHRTTDWLLANKPERDGELERQLSDPFDYTAEDAYAEALADFAAATSTIDFRDIEFVHQYDHPKNPVDVA